MKNSDLGWEDILPTVNGGATHPKFAIRCIVTVVFQWGIIKVITWNISDIVHSKQYNFMIDETLFLTCEKSSN